MYSSWLLPENLSDILPAEARRIEELRRALLDLYRSWGYELVAPPLAEYLDSLMLSNDEALRLRTCKLVDQLSGQTMGVRADMTVQVSRIDSHLLNRAGVTRLCYCGPVIHTRPAGLLADRELLQIGAEIFGYAGSQADVESIRLALESVRLAGVAAPRLDLNHPGIGRALIAADAALAPASEGIQDLLSAKDRSGITQLCAELGAQPATASALCALTTLYGDCAVLERARAELPALAGVQEGLDALEQLCLALPGAPVTIDLADMGTSYGYHSGVVFAIYAKGWHDALVRGGRYDGMGAKFGRARAATGFSLDLRKISSGLPRAAAQHAIGAPYAQDPDLLALIGSLRAQGKIVVQLLPGETPSADEFLLTQRLEHDGRDWIIQDLQGNPSPNKQSSN